MSYQDLSFRKLSGKRFITRKGNELSWDVVEKDDKFGYERVDQGSYRRVFFDLDLKLSKCPMERDEYDECIAELMKACRENAKKYDFVFTRDASYYKDKTEGKLSTHIIFQNKYMSVHITPERTYLEDFIKKTVFEGMKESMVDFFLTHEMIDTAVYTNSVFRMPMSKHEGKMVHYPDKTRPVSDYCVSYVPHLLRDEQMVTLYNEVNAQLNAKFKELVSSDVADTGKKKGRPPKVEAKELPNDTIIQIFQLLDPTKRAYEYKNWVSLMLLCKTLLGDEGVEVFNSLSEQSRYEEYDEKTIYEAYERAKPDGTFTVGTLIHWAKEDSPDELKALLSTTQHSGREEWDVVFVNNTSADSINDLVKHLNGVIVKDQKTKKIWFRNDDDPIAPHCWIEIEKQDIPTYLRNIVYRLNIAMIKPAEEEGEPYQFVAVNKNLDWLEKNVWKYIDRHLPEELGLEDSFITSTHQKTCFQNGVWYWAEKVFRTWEEAKEVRTAVVLPVRFSNQLFRDHPNARRILKSILGKNYEQVMKKIARVLAGNTEDKQWMLGIAMRDSAKSAFTKLLGYCFSVYINEFETANVVVDSKSASGDGSRELAWLRPYRHKRLIIGHEMPSNSANLKLNSKLLKKQSGGDEKSGRECFEKHKNNTSWIDNTTIMPIGNTHLKASTADVWKNCFVVNFPRTFFNPDRDKQEIEDMKASGAWKEEIHDIAKPIEFQQNYEKHRDEIIHFIFSMWQPNAVSCERLDDSGDISVEEKSDSSTVQFNLMFATHFMKEEQGTMLLSDIQQFFLKHPSLEELVKKKDIKAKLLELDGVQESKHLGEKGTLRGFKGIKYVCNCKDE